MTKFTGVLSGQDWLILVAALAGWLLLSGMLIISYAKSAQRIRTEYEAEHAILFPGLPPYRLESFLLDRIDRDPKLFRKLHPDKKQGAAPRAPA